MRDLEDEYGNNSLTIIKIAKQFNCDPKIIRRIVNSFFSRYGIKPLISKGDSVFIRGLGHFVPKIKGKNSIKEKKKKLALFKRRRRFRRLKERQKKC